MKLIELQIQNIRGIRDLTLKPNEKNLVIWGPNGSGKSGVVDAIDFLFTGQIARLMGSGTSGITLAKHGPHIDQNLETAKVRAIISILGHDKQIEISRFFNNPGVLHCKEEEKDTLESILRFTERGQYVLTRRDILKYITSEPSSRAKQIQSILNLTHIEDIRKAIVKVRNECRNDARAAKRSLDANKGAINSTIQETNYKIEKVIQFINNARSILGGTLIDNIKFENVKSGIVPPTSHEKTVLNMSLFEKDLDNLKNPLNQQFSEDEQHLRELIVNINNNSIFAKELARHKLTKQGIDLLDESDICPLCDFQWPSGELLTKLVQRIETAETAEKYHQEIFRLTENLAIAANKVIASIHNILKVIEKENKSLKDAVLVLQDWLKTLNGFISAINEPIQNYLPFQSSATIQEVFDPKPFMNVVESIHSVISLKNPSTSNEQIAWDALTRIEENLKALALSEIRYSTDSKAQKRAEILSESFESARDKVLSTLYNDIQDRLIDLYAALHKEDEQNFNANLEPDGAGLVLEVDFHGRGMHPPHALHSEGHQDSMGLCLYMALTEKLTTGLIDLVVLDDVVMSVDAGHRKALCKLLAQKFPGKQFLITTHDKTWCTQLRTEGIVNSKGVVEFYNWQVDTGPQVNYEVDMWDRIDQALNKEDVPSAAQLLRRGSEQFFSTVCDQLKAPVTYKLSGRWELGDYLPAADSRLKKLLKDAKTAATTWGLYENVEKLAELETTVKQIYSRTNIEQWGINVSVHYNTWSVLSKEDFKPIVQAFKDYYHLFICSKCNSTVYVSVTGLDLSELRCNCGSYNWNLKKKQ